MKAGLLAAGATVDAPLQLASVSFENSIDDPESLRCLFSATHGRARFAVVVGDVCEENSPCGNPWDDLIQGEKVEWGRTQVAWWTHAIRDLHMNDFILAARTDAAAALQHRRSSD